MLLYEDTGDGKRLHGNRSFSENKCKKKIIITGLRVALAYYTYACIVKNGDGNVSRFGFVNKEGEYSSHTVFKEKMMVYSDACSIADRYLKE